MVDGAGTVQRVLVAGRALTAANLRSALGVPAAAASGSWSPEAHADVVASGYEAATDSVIVSTYDGDPEGDAGLRQLVARVPLAGGAPSLVIPLPDPAAGNPVIALVTAW